MMNASECCANPDCRDTAPLDATGSAVLDDAVMKGDVVSVTVLFADLRGYTAVAEHVTPRRMALFLNDYLSAMTDVILARHGMVQDFVGDGILAVFGASSPDADHAWHAAVSAVEMQTALARLGRGSDNARVTAPMGVALHSGEVFAGLVGSPRNRKYTVVGDTVNVASRLEGVNRELGTSIVMSGQTMALLEGRVEARSLGRFPMRGRNHPVEVFELLALRRSEHAPVD